jgi:hypothetical protein
MTHSSVSGECCSACIIYQNMYSLKYMLALLLPVECPNCQGLAESLKTLTTVGKLLQYIIFYYYYYYQ